MTITATLASLAAVEGTPAVLEVFTFAAGAIGAFGVLVERTIDLLTRLDTSKLYEEDQ